MNSRVIAIFGLILLANFTETALALTDKAGVSCAELGITHAEWDQLERDISRAQDKIREYGIQSCMIDDRSSAWFRNDGGIYKLKFIRFSGQMRF